MKIFLSGSEWRKWDLHVHAPGATLNNGYGAAKDEVWDEFCEVIESSDVAVIGITDYFRLDSFFEFIEQHKDRYPASQKVFFPNLELRLNEVVNGNSQIVDLHVIFRPDVTRATVGKFLSELKTQLTDQNGRHLRCSELQSAQDFNSATVVRDDVESAFIETFGKKAVRADHGIVLVPANNNGIRADASERKRNIADQIDKLVDAIFGGSQSTAWYLKTDRFDDPAQVSARKPVFSGSDAHSFEQLRAWLGKDIPEVCNRKEVTWIKVDPTFEGLQQTLVEPEERVRISPIRPDTKEPYKYIAKVKFSGSSDFPEEIPFNQNLCSIIGSRSSGKSALLAYVSHAVDPAYTIKQQREAVGATRDADLGPAVGKTWAEVKGTTCVVEWGDPSVEDGRVIYIPQNSLFAISGRPSDITAKIEPALYRSDPSFHAAYEKMKSDAQGCNLQIRNATEEWFSLGDLLAQEAKSLREMGDKRAIKSTRDALAVNIKKLREESTLTADEINTYQQLIEVLGVNEGRLGVLASNISDLNTYTTKLPDGRYAASDSVSVSIQTAPSAASFPEPLRGKVGELVEQATGGLLVSIKAELVAFRAALEDERESLEGANQKLQDGNQALIAKSQANTEIEAEVQSHKKQEATLAAINAQEQKIADLVMRQQHQIGIVTASVARRESYFSELLGQFSAKERTTSDGGMSFGLEFRVTDQALAMLAQLFNIRENSDYIDRDSQTFNLNLVHSDPEVFLEKVAAGKQKLKQASSRSNASVQVLSMTPEVRFYATLDGDRIGGFENSSMTPGKQALFALTLILDESDDKWPLLIDQPEDDLDSRSIYDVIVPYLTKKKRERQIIMVSHNANLVVGADSEQVIVANRHGDDRTNKDGRTFDYSTGSLEHSRKHSVGKHALGECGIREHACRILDGGETAFQKRKNKYQIS